MELHDPHLFIVLAPELAGHDCNTIQGTVGSAQLMFPAQWLGGTHAWKGWQGPLVHAAREDCRKTVCPSSVPLMSVQAPEPPDGPGVNLAQLPGQWYPS